jgi:hypothetical protein
VSHTTLMVEKCESGKEQPFKRNTPTVGPPFVGRPRPGQCTSRFRAGSASVRSPSGTGCLAR